MILPVMQIRATGKILSSIQTSRLILIVKIEKAAAERVKTAIIT
jgi:hypothetical protein